MVMDMKLTQLALKLKNLVLIDLSFPQMKFPEFKKVYEDRYLYLPCREESVTALAAGLASFGKLVVIYGSTTQSVEFPDSTLNVKVLKESNEASWELFEEGLKAFGPAVLLIPQEV